jgi:hypothetical protein
MIIYALFNSARIGFLLPFQLRFVRYVAVVIVVLATLIWVVQLATHTEQLSDLLR